MSFSKFPERVYGVTSTSFNSLIFTFKNISIYAAFTGLSLGQGGIEYTFYKLFSNTETAVSYLSEKGDNWFSL